MKIKAVFRNSHFGIFTGLMICPVLINLFFFSLRKFLYIHYSIFSFFYYLIAANVERLHSPHFPRFRFILWNVHFAIINMPIGFVCDTFFEY
jgi:hypothetical protein